MSMTALPGDPTTLGQYAARYSRVAEAILETSRRLRAFADDIDSAGGQSITELATRSDAAGTRVGAAQPRYETTSAALATYSVALRDAQDSADNAISAASTANQSLPYYQDKHDELDRYYPRNMLTEDERQDRKEELARIDVHLDQLTSDLAAAEASYDRAVDYRDAAAQVAIDAIGPVLDAMNDTVADYVNAWVGSLPDFLQAIGQWLGDIFVAVVKALQDLIDDFVRLVTYLVVVIMLIPEIMANLPPELWLAALIAPGIVLPIIFALSTYLAARIAKEPLRPTPQMTEITDEGGVQSGSPGDHYSATIDQNRLLDENGGTDATQVQVIEVLDPETGERIGWRVILPSTQDWQEADGYFGGSGPEGDRGAMNDLDSNLALMLTPSQQAAYERAVVQAMLDAGIGPDDPVMLSGWSQGGILAGKMASDPDSPFNIQAIYVSGAPIDGMDIPSTVSVVSVQHEGDVVATLDGPLLNQAHQDPPRWVTVVVPQQNDPATGEPPLVDGEPRNPHNATAYTETAGIYIDGSSDPQVTEVTGRQDMFFSDREVVHVYSGSEKPAPADPLLEAVL